MFDLGILKRPGAATDYEPAVDADAHQQITTTSAGIYTSPKEVFNGLARINTVELTPA